MTVLRSAPQTIADAVFSPNACKTASGLRWTWYMLSDLAYRLESWRHPSAGDFAASAVLARQNLMEHMLGCETCRPLLGLPEAQHGS